jgi:hypothetical protein
MTNDELIALACPIVNDMGWTFYFTADTMAKGAELGLDARQFYVLGRGGVLGDVEGSVVAAAFGYFNPRLISGAWTAGSALVAPRVAGRTHFACSAAHGRDKLSTMPGIDAFVAAADAVKAAADPTGLSLYAGLAAEPLVDDAPGRAMQLVTALRELRGSAHLMALRAEGIDSKTAHFVKRPADIGMFGWTEADAPEITDATLAAMDRAEALTDAIVAPAYGVLDEPGRQAFADGILALQRALTAG